MTIKLTCDSRFVRNVEKLVNIWKFITTKLVSLTYLENTTFLQKKRRMFVMNYGVLIWD